jgi:hypothetical protein
MQRFFILVVAGVTASAAAFADDHDHLRGTYALTGTSSCIQDSASIGFASNFLPNGPVASFSDTVDGVMVFHADGTGTVNVHDVTVVGAGEVDSSDSSYQFTYAIGPDGKLSVKAVPGTYGSTILTGPNAGLTQVVGLPDQSGFIGKGARAITLGYSAPTVQIVTRSNGVQLARICNQSRIISRISDDER